MWIKPDRVVSDVAHFEWGNTLHRIWYIRDSETGLWHRGGGHRTAAHTVLAGNHFRNQRDYIEEREKQAIELFTFEFGGNHQPWNLAGDVEVVMTLVEVYKAEK